MTNKYRMPEQQCPWCGHKTNVASPTHPAALAGRPDRSPKTGDVSVCIQCAKPLKYVSVAGMLVSERLTFEDGIHLPRSIQLELGRLMIAILIVNKEERELN